MMSLRGGRFGLNMIDLCGTSSKSVRSSLLENKNVRFGNSLVVREYSELNQLSQLEIEKLHDITRGSEASLNLASPDLEEFQKQA